MKRFLLLAEQKRRSEPSSGSGGGAFDSQQRQFQRDAGRIGAGVASGPSRCDHPVTGDQQPDRIGPAGRTGRASGSGPADSPRQCAVGNDPAPGDSHQRLENIPPEAGDAPQIDRRAETDGFPREVQVEFVAQRAGRQVGSVRAFREESPRDSLPPGLDLQDSRPGAVGEAAEDARDRYQRLFIPAQVVLGIEV